MDTKDIITHTRKIVVSLAAGIYRSAYEHPFILGMVCFLLLLYRFLPHLFGFLVFSSPVIICTALFLGILLSFGKPNIPEIEEEETTHNISPTRIHAITNALIIEKDDNFSIERHVENKEKTEEAAINEAKFTEQADHVSYTEGGVLLSASNEKEERQSKATVGTSFQFEGEGKQSHIENEATHEREVNNRRHLEKTDLHEATLLKDATELVEYVHLTTSAQTETEVLKLGVPELAVESHFDSSLVSSWKLIDSHDASGSESDHAESSSPDASMADIIPMLDELHPLLDSEDPQPVNIPVDDLQSMSGASTEDGESDDGSGEEEADNQVEGGEEEEAKEENEDGAALAVKWTEDDEKNLKVLGTSEVERNQRLENLIAKRRVWKNLRVEAEKNLIDLDANETVSMMDELSYLQMQIPPISTARRNPFDLPYDSEGSVSLPPIPGSAPSVLLPRRNPFDLPHVQVDVSGSLTAVSHQGSVTIPQREMFFSRHQSFAHGASFTGEFKQEKHDIKLRPYFVSERTELEEASYTHFQRQLSEKSDSKVSSIVESESISSVLDQDFNDESSEQQLHQETEFKLVSSAIDDGKAVERASNSSGEMDSVDPLCTHKEINICSHEVEASTSEVFDIHEAIDGFIKHEEQNRDDLDLCLPISYAVESDVAEEKYSGSSSSCSSELSGKNFSTKIEEGSTDLLQSSGDSLKIEAVNDCHVVEPVYDSSPSSLEKSLSNIASLEEEFLHEGKGSFKSTSSLSSETRVETSRIGSPSLRSERNFFSETEDHVFGIESMAEVHASGHGEVLVAPSNLPYVEENESRSREDEAIREQDVIQVEFTDVNDEYDHLSSSRLPEAPIEQIICYSSSTSTETDSNEDSTMDIGVNLQFTDSVVPNASDYFYSQVPENSQPPLERSTAQASYDTSLIEQHVELLPTVNLSDVEHESSLLHKKSTKIIDGNDDVIKKECVPENDALLFLPAVATPGSNFNCIEVQSLVEEMELSILSEATEINEALSNTCSTNSKDEIHGKQENGLLEHVSNVGASDAVHASIDEIKRIDDEALLLELDAIGDFHVEELRFGDIRKETLHQYNITEKQICEEPSYMKSEAGGAEVLHAETHLELVDSSRDLQEVEARSFEDIHMALKHVSEGTISNPPKLMETICILDTQGIEVCEGMFEESSKQLDVLQLQDVEARSLEDPPKLLDDKIDSSKVEGTAIHIRRSLKKMETEDRLDLEEVEVTPLSDIDTSLKHVCEDTANDLPKLNDKKEESTAVEVTEKKLEQCILEMQTTEKIQLVDAVGVTETDQK